MDRLADVVQSQVRGVIVKMCSIFRCAGLVLLLSGVPFCIHAERVAYVYCDWHSNACKKVFDATFRKLGWAFDAYENVRLHELAANLADYDVVVAGPTANLTHTVNVKDDAALWRRWLNAGGALVIADANYPSVLDSWVGAFGPGFECGCELCSAHKRPTAESCAVTLGDDPILTCPKPLGALLRDHFVQWSHLKDLGPDWRKSIVCSDNQATLASRPTGKGIVILATASMFMGNREIPLALLENVSHWRRMKSEGVELVSFSNEDGEMDLSRGCAIRLRIDPGRIRKVSAELTACDGNGAAKGEPSRAEVVADVPPDGQVMLVPKLVIRRKGTANLTFVLRADGRELLKRNWTEKIPPALDVKLTRKHLFADAPIRPVIVLQPPKEGASKLVGVDWRIDGGDWTLQTEQFSTWEIPVPFLGDGRHEIAFRIHYAEGFLDSLDATRREFLDWGDERTLGFFCHRQVRYRLRSDGTVLEDGRPFFPLGFYYVAWSQSDARRLKAAKDIRGWGYNTLHTGVRPDETSGDGYGAFLDECARLGLRVISEFGSPGKATEVVRRYRDKPAVLGWNPGDEPSLNGLGAETMFCRYDRFKQIDPDHLVYTVVDKAGLGLRYAAGTDVMAPDPYPVPEKSLGMVYSFVTALRQTAESVGSGVWCVPQAFGGQGSARNSGWTRPPTDAEFRAMSYLALMAGAKGLVYYVYYDGGFDLLKEPALLAAVKVFPAELQKVVPFVLNGRLRQRERGEKGRYSAVWEMGEQRLSVAVDISGKVPRSTVNVIDRR